MSSKTKTTATKEEARPALVPKMRFPEFRRAEEWKNKKLSTSVQLVSGMHLSPEQYGTEGAVPYFTGPSDFTNSVEAITKRTSDSASLAKKDDTLITVKGSGVGEIWYLTLPTVAIGRQLMAVRALDASSQFVFQFLLTKWRRFEDLAAGNLIPGLARGDILDLEAPVPLLPEQQKIAECLSSVDELMAAQARKVDALKTHKKGLMQQLFPRAGETQPRLRFPEFQNAGEWEEKKLEDLAKRGSGHTPNKAKQEYYNGGIKWVSLADSKRLDNGLISETAIVISEQGIKNSSAVLHPAGSVILSRDAGVGKSAVMSESMAVSQHFIVWTCDKRRLSNWFLYYIMQIKKPVFESVASGSTIKTIGLPFFKELRVNVPPVPEQQRIATCLSSLDALITAETHKHEALKTHKKGLMQQLFPSPEANEG